MFTMYLSVSIPVFVILSDQIRGWWTFLFNYFVPVLIFDAKIHSSYSNLTAGHPSCKLISWSKLKKKKIVGFLLNSKYLQVLVAFCRFMAEFSLEIGKGVQKGVQSWSSMEHRCLVWGCSTGRYRESGWRQMEEHATGRHKMEMGMRVSS